MTRRLVFLLAAGALAVPAAYDPPPAPPPDRASAAAAPVPHVPAPVPSPVMQVAAADPPGPVEAFVPNQLIVAPPPGTSLSALAARVGGHVVASVGRSGFGVLGVADIDAARRQLDELDAVAAPNATVMGAWKWWDSSPDWTSYFSPESTTTETTPAEAESPQSPSAEYPEAWPLADAHVDTTGDVSGFVVAVLDTGIAYEAHDRFAPAPGLADNPIVAPADFIELDGHANDDHQHGTHIASVIGSQGQYQGVAPGVGLMPVKVLDDTNRGTEWALVEGIHHAVDHHADVINMSLSFPLGYVPSPALAEALERAAEADIVLVAAAGNDGARQLSWPAASRLVLSVGAAVSGPDSTWFSHTDYSNRSPALDILAPGGSLDRDENADGFADGIVAETIVPGDPGTFGLYAYEGTSQAAAMVSGAVVHLLADGVHPRDVAATLQQSQGGYSGSKALMDGAGAGTLDLGQALASPVVQQDFYVGLLPYVRSVWGAGQPVARVTVVDADGQPVADAHVLATIQDATSVRWDGCNTDADGVCLLEGSAFSRADAWAFQVEKVVYDGVASSPSRLLYATEPGEVVLQSVADAMGPSALDEQTSLAVHWADGYDPVLDSTIEESWAVVDSGTGLLSSPMGIVFRPSHVAGLATLDTVTVDPDGTGLLSSPLGIRFSLSVLRVDGTGLLSSPLGFRRLTLVSLQGSGLLSSPLGFHASMLFARGPVAVAMEGSGLLSSPLGFRGQPILMDVGFSQALLHGTAHEAAIAPGGGLTSEIGYDPSTWLVGTGAVEVGIATSAQTSSSGSDSVLLIDP